MFPIKRIFLVTSVLLITNYVALSQQSDTTFTVTSDGRVGIGPAGVAQLRTSPDAVSLNAGSIRTAANAVSAISDVNAICVLPPGIGLNVIGQVGTRPPCA